MMDRLLEIQQALNSESALYLSGFKAKNSFFHLKFKDFILEFLNDLCSSVNTIDSNTNKKITGPSKRRSVGEIYKISKYYFDCDFIKVQIALAKLCEEKKVGYFFCNNLKKRVYMSYAFYKTHTVNPVEYPNPDEWGITPKIIEKLSKKY